jgi:hypothetical protein
MIVTLSWVGLLLRVYHEATAGTRTRATKLPERPARAEESS